MDDDLYQFLGIRNQSSQGLKKSASGRVENLLQKGSASSAKINTMKIKQKAKELKEMRSIPAINNKSRKIAEGLKRERLDVIRQTLQKPEEKTSEPDPVRISVNILKTLEKVEQPSPEPDVRSMNIIERTKYWKDKKEKKLEEQRKAKKEKELDGCTFNPKTKTKSYEEVLNRPQTDRFEEKKFESKEKKNFYEAADQKKNKGTNESCDIVFALQAKELIKIPEPYKQLSPVTQSVRIKPGFLSDLSKHK